MREGGREGIGREEGGGEEGSGFRREEWGVRTMKEERKIIGNGRDWGKCRGTGSGSVNMSGFCTGNEGLSYVRCAMGARGVRGSRGEE